MKLYRVTVPGRSWTMTAPNIQAASQFVKHCPAVRLRTICPMVLDIEVATGAGLDALAQFAPKSSDEVLADIAAFRAAHPDIVNMWSAAGIQI